MQHEKMRYLVGALYYIAFRTSLRWYSHDPSDSDPGRPVGTIGTIETERSTGTMTRTGEERPGQGPGEGEGQGGYKGDKGGGEQTYEYAYGGPGPVLLFGMLLCAVISLVPTPLLEPRYFTPLLLVSVLHRPAMQSAKYSDCDGDSDSDRQGQGQGGGGAGKSIL